MDTNVQTIDQKALVDLFPTIGQSPDAISSSNRFGMSELPDIDILSTPPQSSSSTTEQTTKVEETVNSNEETPKEGEGDRVEADILSQQAAPQKSQEITNLTSYYEERIKNGKFVAVEEEDEKGNKVLFVPKTAEEYDEVLELQISYRLDQEKKDMEKKWYESKSPAWKVVSQYAELVDNPAELIPFISGVNNLQSVAQLDENSIEGAEEIVRTRLVQRGDPEEIVSQQIEALKTTDKLVSTAKQYKPLILKQEQSQLSSMMEEQQNNTKQYMQMVSEIREAAVKEIEQPIFGKTKLKQEEKAIIYDLIGEPSQETQGYGIYNAIDSLFESKDFKTLKEIALLLGKKDSFYNYLGINIANQTAASLEKKLRVAGERSTSGSDYDEDRKPIIQRNQFKTKPTFGRT